VRGRRGGVGQRLSYAQLQDIDFYVLGNPATVTRKLRQLIERLNPGYLLIYGNEGDMAHKDVMRSIELLSKEVIPALHAIKRHPYE
jgi:alkanesulfonate monooxygenase SsuD/methylene tetrahydromethanopterin reductase-like flavin-dependent oxidoreductase (luciferase family)